MYAQAPSPPRAAASIPPHGVSRRLEEVRIRTGRRTLRDFWREVTGDGEFRVSYEAVRNYHTDRDPPVDYLVRVADRFGASLDWLATGRGQPWPSDPQIRKTAESAPEGAGIAEFEGALREVFWHYANLPPLAMAMVLKTCERLHRDAELRARLNGKGGPTRAYIGRFVGKALAGPLVNAVAGTVRTSELHQWQMESYVLGICQALHSLMPNPNWSEPLVQNPLH